MASIIDRIKNDLLEAINASQKKTSAYDTEAEIVRVEGNTAWVHIAGGVPETPVAMTINAQKGDKVQVRVSNEGAWIMGNATAPPTDDTKAEEAKQEIADTNIIVKAVKTIAEQAQKIAGNTNQYFWHTQEGTDTGAHITEIPQEEFLADPNNGGGNLLARSNGIAARDGLTELAQFGANGATIGKTDGSESYAHIDYRSLQMVDKAGGDFFHVSDLRDRTGYAQITESFVGDGTTTAFRCYVKILAFENRPYAVYVDGVLQTEGTDYSVRTSNEYYCDFVTAPANEKIINIVHYTVYNNAKAFTFGARRNVDSGTGDYGIGIGSAALGFYLAASGVYSFAEGVYGMAIGNYSHTEGNNGRAYGTASHVEGYNNEAYGFASHAEGEGCTALKRGSHAEGYNNEAYGTASHVEGEGCTAYGFASHAEGNYTCANGDNSHASGYHTIASSDEGYAIGRYNAEDTSKVYAFIVGNGTSNNRRNIFSINWNGNTAIAGTLTQGSDRRLKEHISFLDEDAIKFIHALKPAYYKKDGENHVGFYAQDVEEIDPWNCMVGEMNGFKTLGYTELIAPLVAYCQSLEKRIEELESE